MAGTSAGAAKAAKTLKKRYGKNYYSTIGKRGRKGGDKSPGSFKAGDARTKKAASLGGRSSRRGPSKVGVNMKGAKSLDEVKLEYEQDI